MYRELIAAAVLVIVGFTAGWVTQDWRLGKKLETMKVEQAVAVQRAETKAREIEQRSTAEAVKLRDIKDAKINDISTKLQSAVSQLRKRPSIGEMSSSPAPKSEAQSCTGAGLYREHAEFLVREAARADEITADLAQCQAAYESIRK